MAANCGIGKWNINLYYGRLGLSGDQIGTLAALPVFILRWLLYSVIDVSGWALLVQLLHGLSFAAFW